MSRGVVTSGPLRVMLCFQNKYKNRHTEMESREQESNGEEGIQIRSDEIRDWIT